ncbi:MAG: XdhC family protein [Rhodobacteraceae bacterium]|nr:XdhC family protein [Paracoccaceae bacterium]
MWRPIAGPRSRCSFTTTTGSRRSWPPRWARRRSISAQGSRRARDLRLIEMQALGAAPADLERLRGPVGLIPSARDAGTLAVSVLAEVLAEAMRQRP